MTTRQDERWRGKRVGEYILGPLLGRGGFADVYLAYHKDNPNRKVAIKILRIEGLSHKEIAEFRQRFVMEASIGYGHNFPHVIRILEQKPRECEGRPCQIMEYVPGGSLADWIERIRRGIEPPVDIETALRIGREIAEGLHALHEAGWIHRDLKPGNILLTSDRRVVIGDLGLVQTRGSVVLRMKAGSLARPLGDPNYWPPEQAAGNPSTVASDVYLWAATLFELLTLKKYNLNKGTRARDHRRNVPRWLDDVLSIALREAPEERFQSINDVLHSLRNRRVSGALVSRGTKRTSWPRGAVVAAVGSVFVGLMLLAVVAVGAFFAWGNRTAGGTSSASNTVVPAEQAFVVSPLPEISPSPAWALEPSPSPTMPVPTPMPSLTPTLVTPQVVFVVVTPTPSPTPTPPYGYHEVCEGAPLSPFSIHQEGYICNASRILIRSKPSLQAGVIGSLPPDTRFIVVGGPECGDRRAWWKVRLYIEDEGYTGMTGWMAETAPGGDEIYLCPLP